MDQKTTDILFDRPNYTPEKTENPPSTFTTVPVTNLEASLNNQINAPMSSSGFPKRLKGVRFVTRVMISLSEIMTSFVGSISIDH